MAADLRARAKALLPGVAKVDGRAVLRARRDGAVRLLAAWTAPIRQWWREVGSPLTEPSRRAVARVASFATPFGWGLILGTGALAILGATLVWKEFSAAAAVGASLVVLCVGFLFGRNSYTTSLDLTRTRVVVGERAVGAMELVNSGTKPLRPVQVELPVGKGIATFSVPRLGPGESHEDLFTIPTQKRTILSVGPISAVRGDPLGLLARVVTWSKPVELFVHPRTVPLDGSSAGVLQDLEGLPSRHLSSSDLSFHAIRDYVPGDDIRHVHWKSTARQRKLMVRQFEETRRSHLAIALSLTAAEYPTDEGFELGISVAGSLGVQALKEDKQLTTLVQGAELPARTGKRFLDSLSGLEPTPEKRGGMVELALEIQAKVPDASVAVLICGSNVTPDQIRKASSQIPVGVIVVAIYCDPGARVTRRGIGDTVVLTLGDLQDLPRLLRRVFA